MLEKMPLNYTSERTLQRKGGTILYKARQLKKASLIKDTFSRDGAITIRMLQLSLLIVIIITVSPVRMS